LGDGLYSYRTNPAVEAGKVGHIGTIPVPEWIKETPDSWTLRAGINAGPLLRSINKTGRIWGHGFTPKEIWAIVRANAKRCGLPTVAPHDLRRTCARLCHQAGGELEQIQFLLGHVSIQTTERYLGCKQRFRDAVNDHRSGTTCVIMIGVAGES
jgi:integrase